MLGFETKSVYPLVDALSTYTNIDTKLFTLCTTLIVQRFGCKVYSFALLYARYICSRVLGVNSKSNV